MYTNKHTKRVGLFFTVLIGFSIGTVNAAPVTVPNTFTAGTPAVAADVNANFDAVKTAVDDNDGRATTNATNIGANSAGVATNATAVTALQAANNTAGAATITAAAFRDENTDAAHVTGCQWSIAAAFGFFDAVVGATTASCDARASIQLPHGRTLAGLSCVAFDNTALTSIEFVLARISTTGSFLELYTTAATADGLAVQQLSDTTINGPEMIDNTLYGYQIEALFSATDFSNIDFQARIYTCTVSYI